MNCNHCLLSLTPYVLKSTTACSKSGSVPFIAINNQDSCLRPSFMTFLCFLCATTLACTFLCLLASTLHYSKFSHSKQYSHPIPAPLSFSSVRPAISTTPSPNSSNFPTPLTTIKMVEYTGENANRFSFSGAAAQLRGGSPTAPESSGSSSGGSPPRM